MTSRKCSKNGGDGGTFVYMREGTTSRMMVADRPFGEFYDFYSVRPVYFGYHVVFQLIPVCLPIPLPCAECDDDDSLPFSRASSIPSSMFYSGLFIFHYLVYWRLGCVNTLVRFFFLVLCPPFLCPVVRRI
jgi:hypothetical protein